MTGSLMRHSDALVGFVELPSRGLWFVYAELRAGGTVVETWLPIQQDEVGQVSARRSVYLPAGTGTSPAGQYVAGSALLAVGAALVGWAGVAVGRRRPLAGDVL